MKPSEAIKSYVLDHPNIFGFYFCLQNIPDWNYLLC